ncbi:MAG: YdcF family protein [Planctomycetota bacterium]
MSKAQRRTPQAVQIESRTGEAPDGQPKRRPLVRTFVCAAGVALLLIAIGTVLHGKIGFEKTLTYCIKPFGACWLLFTGFVLASLGPFRVQQFTLVCGWLLLTVASCGPISYQVTRYLEESIDVPELSADDPLDAVLVLGGGTADALTRAQVSSAGDRVVYGAQLYHRGIAKRLITSGTAIKSMAGEALRGPADQTQEIWQGLGIPADKILVFEGRNTFEEIRTLSEALEGDLAGMKIGILTSAIHLPRAMRLAQARGLEDIVPIAADYRYHDGPKPFMYYLPGAQPLYQLAAAEHEIIAKLVNR